MAFYGNDYTDLISTSEISKYYNKGCWGNIMDGIKVIEPCVYICDENKSLKIQKKCLNKYQGRQQ